MNERTVRCLWSLLGAAMLLCPVFGQSTEEPTSSGLSELRATIDSYVTAYNAKDAATIAAHWTEKGEWIFPDGMRIVGRAQIEETLRRLFEQIDGIATRCLDIRK